MGEKIEANRVRITARTFLRPLGCGGFAPVFNAFLSPPVSVPWARQLFAL